ncbi:MAG: radical SAM protein [Candidatus Omnitrophica bacterium]|nr:radical SAM protein [Candidatus Omnitrophota bacterium]
MKPEAKNKPEFACLGVTDDCMLRCKMCYKWKDDIFIKKDHYYGIPTLEQYERFFLDLRVLVDEGFIINFGGGEALLHKDIFKLIKIASSLGFRINLNSNGFLIDEVVARKLGEAGLVDIKLSLDSLQKQKHDYLRGVDGVYDQLRKAIDNLHAYAKNVNISIISVIYEQNYREFIPLIEWINNNEKINHVLVMAAMQPNNTLPEEHWWEGEYGALWPKDTGQIEKLLDQLIVMKNDGYKICNPVGQLKAVKKYFKNPREFVKKTICNMYKAIHLSSIGLMYLCFEYEVIGDIKKNDDVKNIWHSDKAQQIRDEIKNCKKNCHFLINCFFEED